MIKTSIVNNLGHNNLVLKAQMAGGGKPNANYSKVHKISRQETAEIYLVLFDNGIITFTGIDKYGLQTLSFSNTPHCEAPLEAFGDDWKKKISKAQSYTTKELVDIEQVKERLAVSEADYPEVTMAIPFSKLTRI